MARILNIAFHIVTRSDSDWGSLDLSVCHTTVHASPCSRAKAALIGDTPSTNTHCSYLRSSSSSYVASRSTEIVLGDRWPLIPSPHRDQIRGVETLMGGVPSCGKCISRHEKYINVFIWTIVDTVSHEGEIDRISARVVLSELLTFLERTEQEIKDKFLVPIWN